MIEAGILEGDYVVVRKQNAADDGDIVVALLGIKATVKTFYLEEDGSPSAGQCDDGSRLCQGRKSCKVIGYFASTQLDRTRDPRKASCPSDPCPLGGLRSCVEHHPITCFLIIGEHLSGVVLPYSR